MKSNFTKLTLIIISIIAGYVTGISQQIISADFNTAEDQFSYQDDIFKGTNAPAYANGVRTTNTGVNNSGALTVTLGGIDGNEINGMSGGWTRSFNMATVGEVIISFQFKITQAGTYEENEISETLLSIDNQLVGIGSKDYIDQIKGDGNSGPTIGSDQFFEYKKVIGPLSVGSHTISLGGFNSLKTLADEITFITIDDVSISALSNICDDPKTDYSQKIVNRAIFSDYKARVTQIASFGDRSQLTSSGSTSYDQAEAWAIQDLQNMGYIVEFANYTFQGDARKSMYVTKVSDVNPDKMYIVSGHLDGRGGGNAANDDGSGSAIVMEIAKILSDPNIKTDISIRMILWNNEESGLNGSAAYVSNRSSLQGIENPQGSGIYPEPDWLGVIQHDMMMFDHGLVPGPNQIPGADVDI
ncbi:MAG: M28 family peptidase, partial [Saprospiraceae bacterium]